MSLGVLALSGDGDVTERLLVPQVFEGRHHVGLEIVPAETELITVSGTHLGCFQSQIIFSLSIVTVIRAAL